MAIVFNYAILQLVPYAHRDEAINVGVVIFVADQLDVRLSASPTMLSYFGVQAGTLDWLVETLRKGDHADKSAEQRHAAITSLSGVRLSEIGWFVCDSISDYESLVAEIMTQYVEKPEGQKRRLSKKTLLSDLKRVFQEYEIYGTKADDINRHKIVSRMPVGPSGKLHVDFLLKNGAYHATETLDFRTSHEAGANELKNAALANVTFQHTRDYLGASETRCYLVYAAPSLVERNVRPAIEIAERGVTQSFNLESREDKARYLDVMLVAAGVNHLFS